MQRKDLALRVLSTAAIMSIVTSIAAPAFADIYYIGNGSIDVEALTNADGEYVKVTQGGKTYTDKSNEIVIKDGTSEANATLTEETRIEEKRAEVAIPDDERHEPEATGSADAAGESRSDPDAGVTQNETGEDSAQTQESKDNTKEEEDSPKDPSTDNPTANPKKDVVYQYDPAADPNPEQPATKLAPTTSADPAAETREAALAPAPAADPAPTTPAEGSSAANPSKNVIRVINNWAERVLNIRLSNVNIKSDDTSKYADGKTDVLYNDKYRVSAAEVKGTGNTKIELDGQNVLDSSACDYWAGLSKKGSGNLTITDKTSDKGETITAKKEADTSGSLRAEGGRHGGAAIGGSCGQATENITIEGYATVKANTANTLNSDAAGIGGGGSAKGSNITIQGHANVTADGGLSGAGIGGGSRSDNGCGGDAENITIQDYAKVTATGKYGAAIGSGSSWDSGKNGDARKIVICGHATVNAKNNGYGAAIGAAGKGSNASAEVIIGTAGATAEEDVHITATGLYGSAIGNGAIDTNVTIQGHVTIHTASGNNNAAIGSGSGNVKVNIKDNVAIDNEDTVTNTDPYYISSGIGGGYIASGSDRTVEVNIDGGTNGNVRLGEESAITGYYGAVSGTEVNIGNNVLLKMKERTSSSRLYIAVKGAEAAVGTRSNPNAGGLVNTIGNNTQLWYTDFKGELQKIVHSKNLCKKELVKETHATCTTPGSKTYECTYEHDNSAVAPEHTEQWTETIDALGHDFTVKQSETPATCETAGTIVWKCSRCDETKTETIPALNHDYRDDWAVTTPATCTTPGVETRYCHNNNSHFETRPTAKDSNNHTGHGTHIEGYVAPTCTKDGYTGDTYCDGCNQKIKDGTVIPATGHHWVDKGDGTHICPDCGATEGQPFNTNSALELRVVDAEGMDQPFTVSQNGTLRTYTGAYDTATLTGDLDTLRYLQDHGAQTIQFVTNGQTSSFVINDLLAQGSGSEVFYLTHRGTEEPTLLLVEADHSELVKD